MTCKVPDSRMIVVKAALRMDQVRDFNLPRSMLANPDSSRFARFKERHGTDAWEVEAISPEVLATELRKSIDGLIDHAAFERERKQESVDAQYLEGVRRATMTAIGGAA